MNIEHWEPTSELSLLQGDVNRLFDRFFGGGPASGTQRWSPPLDVIEHADHYVLHADLPGLEEGDVTIEVRDRTIRISGERQPTHDHSREGFQRIERPYGSFDRVMTLPEGTAADAIKASFDKGVLELVIPKPVQAKPLRIEITKPGAEVEGSARPQPTRDASPKRTIKDCVLAYA